MKLYIELLYWVLEINIDLEWLILRKILLKLINFKENEKRIFWIFGKKDYVIYKENKIKFILDF